MYVHASKRGGTPQSDIAQVPAPARPRLARIVADDRCEAPSRSAAGGAAPAARRRRHRAAYGCQGAPPPRRPDRADLPPTRLGLPDRRRLAVGVGFAGGWPSPERGSGAPQPGGAVVATNQALSADRGV